ncbi:MAG TPA: IS701 family transposase [Candidatus Saccharimonadales bacterium]|nr:IS701 family transposase [Candidatus Saccharimonadales bacterium]
MSDYSEHFLIRGKDVSPHASDYLSGLLGTYRRKNLECIHGDIPESNYQAMQQFVSDSPWSQDKLMTQVAGEVNGLLGANRHSALLIDETSFVKKGDHSVGVQRQYCGRLGKKENCQLGVFACLGLGEKASVVDFRLFLPESWAQSDERCEKAKIPEEQRQHRTKLELALDMVKGAQARGLQFSWVLADAAYGCSNEFCATLEKLGLHYLLDASMKACVWDADPEPYLPARPGKRGRPETVSQPGNSEAKRYKLPDLLKERFVQRAREVVIRKTSQGELRAKVWVCEVWLWEDRSAPPLARRLVAREMEGGEIKVSWTNAPKEMSDEELAYMQGQRHWIERGFEDAKSQLGMADYEVRKWRGWHHHMAMVALAMLFLLKERVEHEKSAPLLSARDIVELLAFYLPRRRRKEAEVISDLVRRHEQRRAATKSHARSQRRKRSKS